MNPEILESRQTQDGSLRIMQLGPTLYLGGVAVAIKQLSLDLVRMGNEVMLIGNGGEGMDKLADAGVNCQEVEWSGKIPTLLRCTRKIRQHFQDFQPDIVHVHGRGASLACILAGRQPDYLTLHNSILTDKVGLLDIGFVRKYFSPLGHRIFALNQEAVDYLTSQLNFQAEHIEIITNGVDCDRFRPPTRAERTQARLQFGVESQETMALFVGRFHEQKQPETVVELAKATRDAGIKGVRFVLVGSGPLEEVVRERIHSLGLQDICHIYDWMDPLFPYWAADLLLMPSLYEGFGLVAAEALACGCPVLRTMSGGYDLMIREGITGFACETTQEAFIAKGLEVLQQADALETMRSATRTLVLEKLSIRQQTRQTVAAYRRLLAEKQPLPAKQIVINSWKNLPIIDKP
jgi:glycosyltransferase involved in cell wall biosynthesis